MKRLGPYTLEEPLGHGGMADVWRASDGSGEQVAVKLLRSEFADELLRREIQMMGRLDHPSIVRMRRWGEVSTEESEHVELPSGTPWIAMDLATRGTLMLDSITSWRTFRRLALQLLDALMHAHARGVIHRDIKPENILVSGSDDAPRYVLTDFGIAFPHTATHHGTDESRYAAAGTPHYMAPEQNLGRWREFDLHTDLFSLGVVLFEVATGTLPFTGASRVELAMAHSRGAPPLRNPRFPLPVGFEDWMNLLLAFEPTARFAYAADAAYALLLLREAAEAPFPTLAGESWGSATTLPVSWATASEPNLGAGWKAMRATVHVGGMRLPTVRDWRSPQDGSRDPMGLDLFGLHRAGIVAREAERDQLWATLVEMIESDTARAVVVRGPNGIGSARLTRWLGERAAELGMAAQVRTQRRRGTSGLADTLAHEMGLVGLDEQARLERLREIFGEAVVDIELIARAVEGVTLPIEGQVRAVRQVLEHFSQRRPIVTTVFDAHDEPALMECALTLIGAPLPILMVLAVNDDTSERTPHCQAQLDALLQSEYCVELRLGPLKPTDMAQFVDTVHAVSSNCREAVIRHANGNPLHALQLLEVAVGSGDIPGGTLADVWRRRVADALGARNRDPLVAAALLGESARLDVWRARCNAASIEVADDLVDQLVKHRLWEVDDYSYRFEHRSLRSAILSDSAAARRVAALVQET